MTPHHLHLENGVRLPYLDIGDSGAPPVLLLRGLGDGLGTVEQDYVAGAVRALLAPYRDMRFVVPSWRVPAPAGYTLSAMAADAARLLTELRLGPVPVWGNSLGGMVALRLAQTCPELVTRVVCECTPCRVSPDLARLVERWTGLATRGRWTRLQRETLARIFTGRMPWQVRRLRLLAWRIPRPDEPGRFGVLATASYAHDATQTGAAVRCPVLVLGGRQDVMTRPGDLGELADVLPQARLHLLDRCGHGVSLEQPTAAWAQIEPFLMAGMTDHAA